MGGNLVIIYYLCASEIWPEKRIGLPYGGQFSNNLLSLCI